jgi:hypothetical protein
MDGLFDTLDDYASDRTKLPAIRMAAKRGLTVLKKYYGKTDESAIFRIAMSMYIFMYDINTEYRTYSSSPRIQD